MEDLSYIKADLRTLISNLWKNKTACPDYWDDEDDRGLALLERIMHLLDRLEEKK